MSNNEFLLAISDMMDRKLKPIHTNVAELREDMRELKTDVEELREDMRELKGDVAELREDMRELKGDVVRLKTDVAELQEDMAEVKANIAEQQVTIDNIQAGMKKMQFQMETDLSPRLQNIESCYLSTYQRYSKGTEQIDSMQMDIDVLKSTVIEHSEKLQRIS